MENFIEKETDAIKAYSDFMPKEAFEFLRDKIQIIVNKFNKKKSQIRTVIISHHKDDIFLKFFFYDYANVHGLDIIRALNGRELTSDKFFDYKFIEESSFGNLDAKFLVIPKNNY